MLMTGERVRFRQTDPIFCRFGLPNATRADPDI
jgi:hypothetical protein